MKEFKIRAETIIGRKILNEYYIYKDKVVHAKIEKISDEPLEINCKLINTDIDNQIKVSDIEKVTWAVFVGIAKRLRVPVSKNDYSLVVLE